MRPRDDSVSAHEGAVGVVVGYDGSSSAERALQWAAVEAFRRRRPLTVLYANDWFCASAGMLAASPSLINDASAVARAIAEEGAVRAREVALVDVRLQMQLSDPTTTLLTASRTADLLVMGCRGRGPVAAAFLGSTTFSVTARASCPVVVVRGTGERVPAPADRWSSGSTLPRLRRTPCPTPPALPLEPGRAYGWWEPGTHPGLAAARPAAHRTANGPTLTLTAQQPTQRLAQLGRRHWTPSLISRWRRWSSPELRAPHWPRPPRKRASWSWARAGEAACRDCSSGR